MTMTTKKQKLTKAEIRIAIAKDVIAQIKAKKYKPTQGTWVADENQSYDQWLYDNALDCKVDVRDYTNNIKKCNVCALGSLFVSAVNKYNNVYGTYWSVSAEEVFNIDNEYSESPLLRYFTLNQLQLIEFTFERGLGVIGLEDDHPMVEKANTFFLKYSKSKDRLVAIMKNIIKNKGTFKP